MERKVGWWRTCLDLLLLSAALPQAVILARTGPIKLQTLGDGVYQEVRMGYKAIKKRIKYTSGTPNVAILYHLLPFGSRSTRSRQC